MPKAASAAGIALAVIVGLSACGLVTDSPPQNDPVTQARLEFCGSLGGQMMTMMSLKGAPPPDPQRYQEAMQTMTQQGTKVRDLDPAAPALDADVSAAFEGTAADQTAATAAFSEMNDYCDKYGMGFGGPSPSPQS